MNHARVLLVTLGLSLTAPLPAQTQSSDMNVPLPSHETTYRQRDSHSASNEERLARAKDSDRQWFDSLSANQKLIECAAFTLKAEDGATKHGMFDAAKVMRSALGTWMRALAVKNPEVSPKELNRAVARRYAEMVVDPRSGPGFLTHYCPETFAAIAK